MAVVGPEIRSFAVIGAAQVRASWAITNPCQPTGPSSDIALQIDRGWVMTLRVRLAPFPPFPPFPAGADRPVTVRLAFPAWWKPTPPSKGDASDVAGRVVFPGVAPSEPTGGVNNWGTLHRRAFAGGDALNSAFVSGGRAASRQARVRCPWAGITITTGVRNRTGR